MTSRKAPVKTFGDWAYLAIAKHYQKTISHEAGVLADQDPEELHQMRVGMRRLRSVLVGFAPALCLTEGMDQKKVGKCGQVLGRLRDLDVMQLSFAKTYLPYLPKVEKKVLKNALDKLDSKREKQLKKVRDFLESDRYLSVKNDFETWLKTPQYQAIATVDIRLILPDLLLPQLSELLLHEGWWVGYTKNKLSNKKLDQIFTEQSLRLHDLRKVAKRSRYNMELFQQFYGTDYAEKLRVIKEVQTLIGDFQDDAVLSDFLQDALEDNIDQELPTLVQIFTNNRRKTWDKWTKLQHQFLTQDYRLQLHRSVCNFAVHQLH